MRFPSVRGLLRSAPGPARLTPLLVGLVISCSASHALAMRCNGKLVGDDDWPIEVVEKCGEPDYIARYPEAVIPGLGVVQMTEHWYYNRGPQQFIRRLTFRSGRLRGIETLGYGFVDGPRKQCQFGALHEGISEYELFARCGEPLSRRESWQYASGAYTKQYGGYGIIPVEEWLYDVGRNRFRQVVRLENGRVTRITSGNRRE